MENNKLSNALKIIKIVILALTILAFVFFSVLVISAKVQYANVGGQGWEGVGVALAVVLALVYGGVIDGVFLIFSFIMMIVALNSKNKILKNQNNLISEESQSLLVEKRKKDVKHFILLTILPIVTYVITLIICIL